MGVKGIIALLAIGVAGYLTWRFLPPYYNPFAPFSLDDPPGRIAQFKLRRLPEASCPVLLQQANERGWISSKTLPDSDGPCPLHQPVRVMNFEDVRLSSALFVQQQIKPLAQRMQGSALRQIDHLGSYACRNIYHRENARLSEHASADALDVSGFRFANGQRITVLKGWYQPAQAPFLQAVLSASCRYYGNGLGPEYNAAHANHFHLGMRGYGLCR